MVHGVNKPGRMRIETLSTIHSCCTVWFSAVFLGSGCLSVAGTHFLFISSKVCFLSLPAAFSLDTEQPDYDLDSDDEAFLIKLKKKMEISFLQFEEMIDRLEKGSGQQVGNCLSLHLHPKTSGWKEGFTKYLTDQCTMSLHWSFWYVHYGRTTVKPSICIF